MVRAVHRALHLGAAVRAVVPRRQAQRLLQLRRPARRGGRGGEGRVPLGRRAGGRHPHDHVRRSPTRRRALRERAEEARREEGHARRDLHGDGSGVAGRDARLHAARRAAHRRLRRLLRRLALGPDERHEMRGPDHAGRGVAPWLDGAAQEGRRRSDGRRAGHEAVRRPPPHRQRRPDAGRPRPLVARACRRLLRRPRVVPVRADGQRGPALPHVHERHDREAEGHRPHDRRLPRRRGVDEPLRPRPQAGRRRLLVRRRHRLDHRPQLHRLRAAVQRRDVRPLRGHARLPRQGPLVGDHRSGMA